MTVDRNGELSTVENRPFQAAFRPVLEAVSSQLTDAAPSPLHSLYVYGSVAAGVARPGISDLDLCLVLKAPPTVAERADFERIRRAIEAEHPVVSKIDFDIGSIEDVFAPDTRLAWQVWLKHYCRCLVGADLRDALPLFQPSRAVAVALNGDFAQVLERYLGRIAEEPAPERARPVIRAAARKLIRSTNILRHPSDTDWPETLEDHVRKFRARFPEQGREILYLLEQATTPDALDPDRVADRLRAFATWLRARSDMEGGARSD